METAFRLTKIGALHVAFWLHTAIDPLLEEWSAACTELRALKHRSPAVESSLRTLIISDGGAPDSRQRAELSGIFTVDTKTSLISNALSNPVKQALVSLFVTWLNPGLRAYPPARAVCPAESPPPPGTVPPAAA